MGPVAQLPLACATGPARAAPARAGPACASPRQAAPKAIFAGPGLSGNNNQGRSRSGPLRAASLAESSLPPQAPVDGSPSPAARAAPSLSSLLDRGLNLGLLAVGGGSLALGLLCADASPWELYQQAVASNPIETKGAISGVVYSLGDVIAQTYEGRAPEDWDRARIVRSGLCGLLAHGPLSHLYYLGLDHAFAHQALIPAGSWGLTLAKVGIDQTAWSLLWNSTYYVLLGLMKFESPAVIAATVRGSWWDLLQAGWRLWPLVHLVTYGLLPIQHRLLFVDAVELVWVSILSAYGQQQRQALEGAVPGPVACALPGADGEGGDAAEEILRGIKAEREIIFEDAGGQQTVVLAADLYASTAAADFRARRRA